MIGINFESELVRTVLLTLSCGFGFQPDIEGAVAERKRPKTWFGPNI
jgi:hypothetical protein